METGPRFIVPSDGLVKPGIKPGTPGIQGEGHNHCTTEASPPGLTHSRKGHDEAVLCS